MNLVKFLRVFFSILSVDNDTTTPYKCDQLVLFYHKLSAECNMQFVNDFLQLEIVYSKNMLGIYLTHIKNCFQKAAET